MTQQIVSSDLGGCEESSPEISLETCLSEHRIPIIDLVRGLALFGMIVYHFSFDLERFGVFSRGFITRTALGRYSAEAIASTFIFISGVSLFLAHHKSINWKTFIKRTSMAGGGAVLITAVTYFSIPREFIFFGILHCITLWSIVGLLVLRLPWWSIFCLSLFLLTGEYYMRSEFFDGSIWWWLGLSQRSIISADYIPVFPWMGYAFAGLSVAKFVEIKGGFSTLSQYEMKSKEERILCFLGRHTLVIYLLHQPILIGILYVIFEII